MITSSLYMSQHQLIFPHFLPHSPLPQILDLVEYCHVNPVSKLWQYQTPTFLSQYELCMYKLWKTIFYWFKENSFNQHDMFIRSKIQEELHNLVLFIHYVSCLTTIIGEHTGVTLRYFACIGTRLVLSVKCKLMNTNLGKSVSV